eukprot:TRINITY_DN33265_c0_g1_i2.p1 TRINITY_DN33265_c0_g1~~TRINITY_DN33265_c0_g1_i2.p1  ORF type:complete len:103 (-),score=37.54 TRINITY_DN33265_c0_g1_i2:58-366(-)
MIINDEPQIFEILEKYQKYNNENQFQKDLLRLVRPDDESLKINEEQGKLEEDSKEQVQSVSYTHLTLPTICSVQISVVAVSLKKKKKNEDKVKEGEEETRNI